MAGEARENGDGYPPETTHGTTAADHRHVSPEEADQALDTTRVEPELPEPDPRFDID